MELVRGWARFSSPYALEVDDRVLTAPRFVLSTGSSAAVPPVPGLDAVPVLDNRTVFQLVRAAGAPARAGWWSDRLRAGQALARLGTRVTLVEAAPRLLLREEPEAAPAVARALERDGVTVLTGATVQRA